MNLWQDFLINDGKVIYKWSHYFPIYERHFQTWRNKSLTFLEIGVADGGSLQMWQRYFGPLAKIVGIDIDPNCRHHESPPAVMVRTGDQSDHAFLQSIIDEFGPPDIVLDDGSHHMGQILDSFSFLYPLMPKNGIYMVEDLHTAYWKEYGGGATMPENFINVSKNFIDKLNADHSRGEIKPDIITRDTFGISFYDSVIAFEKGNVFWKAALKTGKV